MIFLYERFTANKSQTHIYIGAVFAAADVEDRYPLALGLMPRQRFADYLKGNDIDDFRRDASMIAEDMNKVINGEREKDF